MTWVRRWVARVCAVRIDDVRALIWTIRSLRRLRPDLAASGTAARVPGPPDGIASWAVRSVAAYLRCRQVTCFERTLILQSWLGAHGRPAVVAIGVSTADGFKAHAWLVDLDPPSESEGYEEIRRIAWR